MLCFVNLTVCKFKNKEYESVVNITDQVLEMDPTNAKGLYFRGKAYLELKDHDKAQEALATLVKADPTHTEGRKEYERIKKVRREHIEN